MPDFSKVTTNPPAAIHHQKVWLSVCYDELFCIRCQYMQYYIDFFGKRNGSAFVLKPDHLRYFEKIIAPMRRRNKDVSYATKKMDLLGGSYTGM